MVQSERGRESAVVHDYPLAWAFDGLLTNGSSVLIRPIRARDAPQLVCFGDVLVRRDAVDSNSTQEAAESVADADYSLRMAFVAIASDEIVAVATYDRAHANDSAATIIVDVKEPYRQHGVATLLFESLAAYARSQGVERFHAEVATGNENMLGVLHALGLRMDSVVEGDVVRLDIDLRPTSEYRATCDEREAVAEAASMAAVLRPRVIAVVGAGRRPGSAGHEVVRSLLAGDVTGTVYPVNPKARSVCGVAAFPDLSSVPERVDLAIVAVPAAQVSKVLQEAALSGVRAVTVITAGFAETGQVGAAAETELLSMAREYGMRIVGPNCLGLVNTDPEVRMNATFAGLDPLPGRLALISQSGAVGIALAEQASAAGVGLSSFISVGNKLDVSSNDLLCFFERDERTSVIALYLESLGNPRKFARIARRISEHKPIVALKAGRSAAGARGARSHTAAAATPEVSVEALLRSAGVIKVDRLEELLDVSMLVLAAPLPAGRRVALLGNSGGPLILAADACEANGLLVTELDEATTTALHGCLAAAAATSNPVDLTADGTRETLERALEIVLADAAIDAVIVVVTEVICLSGHDARLAVEAVASRFDKPLVSCVLGRTPSGHELEFRRVAEIPTPERAASALAHLCRYAQWRNRPRISLDEPTAMEPPSVVREIVSDWLAENPAGGWLGLDEAARLLSSCGLPILATHAVFSADEAAAVGESLGFPVVLKARSGDLVHKSDVGGVATSLTSASAVRAAYEEMSARLGQQMGGAVIQPMAKAGVEAIVGLTVDPVFGSVVMVGLGGVMTDVLGDRAFAVPPLDPREGQAMVSSLRAAPLLDGFRGAPPVDRRALAALVEKVARVAEEVPELVELDLNPVIVTPDGALVVDCKARLAPRHLGPGPLFRALGPRG
jgi:acyl-CoA synthetase (NDP forming)/RimJ/RimL family protein N-acetyltransferase